MQYSAAVSFKTLLSSFKNIFTAKLYTMEYIVNIGEEIKEELFRQERTISWLARKLHCDRSNIYSIFRRKSIDTDLLMRTSIILKRNFFILYMRYYEETEEQQEQPHDAGI